MKKSVHVQFFVQPHFSLLAFAAAADALTTTNLVLEKERFFITTLSIDQEPVISDLAITIQADHHVDDAQLPKADIVIVCGGYRCDLNAQTRLTWFLDQADKAGASIGGLWNGIIAPAHAGLMTGYTCTLHHDNHEYARERFPELLLSQDSLVLDRTRLSAAGPNSSFELMLLLIQRLHGSDTVNEVRHILKADSTQVFENSQSTLETDTRDLPDKLQRAVRLMRNNLDEPLSRDDLASDLGLSKRALERLFQHHLNTSPTRYYMECRLNRAHTMLLQSSDSITSIADSCGFVSGAHFSRRYTKHFGCSPRSSRKSTTSLLDHR